MRRVGLFTDEPVLALGLASALSGHSELELVLTSQSIQTLAGDLAAAAADVALLDLVPEVSFSLLSELKRRVPQCRLVLWARTIPVELAFQMMELNVRGILHKTLPVELAVKCLVKVGEGELWFDKALTAELLQGKTISLTRRESQLVTLLAQGLKNKEIAAALMITEGSVKVYLTRLFAKVGVKDRFEMALWGLKHMVGTELPLGGRFAAAKQALAGGEARGSPNRKD